MNSTESNPFRKLLICYVLKSIGELDAAEDVRLKGMEAKLGAVYGMEGTWFEIVAAQMDFPDTLPDEVKGIWERGSAKAKEMDINPDPEEFASNFVDQNFADA